MAAGEIFRLPKFSLKATAVLLGLFYMVAWLLLNGILVAQDEVQSTDALPVTRRSLPSGARQDQEKLLPGTINRQAHAHEDITAVQWEKLLEAEEFYVQAHKLAWIRQRIARMKSFWERAQAIICKEKRELCSHPQRVLIFPGLLTEVSYYDFATNAFKGGYLGELVQWSDLIAALFVLGHHLTIQTSHVSLPSVIPDKSKVPFDVIFTDYMGLVGLHRQDLFSAVKCRLRILDSFGTEPEVVFRKSLKDHNPVSTMFTGFTIENFRQMLTLYPHTPDNSFLGHVVDVNLEEVVTDRRNTQAVVYGKEGYYLKDHADYLKAIAAALPVHVTTKDKHSWMPAELIHHGVLHSSDLHRLLRSSKIFVGLGFPFEGPAPLEALADGCVFLQARFSPAKSYKNDAFFKGKPTHRLLTSQHPYLENFVGKPYVYTVNLNNLSEVRRTVDEIIARKEESFRPFLPYEFTAAGFVERVGSFVAFQNFCPSSQDVALRLTATASSVLPHHDPGEAVDGLLDSKTCFWSRKEAFHWWLLNLGRVVPIHTLRIDNMLDWWIAEKWKETFAAPFRVLIQDAQKRQIIARDFVEPRLFYSWSDIGVSGQYIRIESLSTRERTYRYFVLCGVSVYSDDPQPAVWPSEKHLKVKVGDSGMSCTNACRKLGLVCEPAYFQLINSIKVLKDHWPCSTYNSGSMSSLPGRLVRPLPNFQVGDCATNSEPLLLSCAGRSVAVRRVCPCRRYKHHQVALVSEMTDISGD